MDPLITRVREFCRDDCVNKPCYFFYLLSLSPSSVYILNQTPKAQVSLSCQFLTNLLFLCLKNTKVAYFDHFLGAILWELHTQELEFVYFAPGNLPCVNFIISPATRSQRGRGGNFPLPNKSNQSRKFQEVVKEYLLVIQHYLFSFSSQARTPMFLVMLFTVLVTPYIIRTCLAQASLWTFLVIQTTTCSGRNLTYTWAVRISPSRFISGHQDSACRASPTPLERVGCKAA